MIFDEETLLSLLRNVTLPKNKAKSLFNESAYKLNDHPAGQEISQCRSWQTGSQRTTFIAKRSQDGNVLGGK